MEAFTPDQDRKEAYIGNLLKAFPGVDAEGVALGSMMFFFANSILDSMAAHLGRYGLSQARFGVLLMIFLEPDIEWTPAELADAGNMSRATMTGLLDRLEKQNYIVRAPRPGDRRSITIQLSPEGRAFIEESFPDHFKRLAGAMRNLTPEETQTLMKILPRVSQCFAALVQDIKP